MARRGEREDVKGEWCGGEEGKLCGGEEGELGGRGVAEGNGGRGKGEWWWEERNGEEREGSGGDDGGDGKGSGRGEGRGVVVGWEEKERWR